jgi:NAD(P)-dependent dehydrogenase (short-subunit alcohol dehydrogenase family)
MGVLDGKAVVVTGAGRGLGRAYALHAATSGAAVVVNDVDAGPAEHVVGLIHGSGGRATASIGSVADPRRAAAAIERCLDAFGRIDGLVNNAGVRYQAPLCADDPRWMRALIEVNVLGSMYCASAAARAMRAQGSGSIVNVGSLAMVGRPTAAAYSASKGAVASMTVAWAAELAEQGVRVNCVCPVAWTRMAQADSRAPATAADTPDRIAPVVTFLLSDLAIGITGQLVRYVSDKLHIVGQVSAKEPVLRHNGWDTDDIARAFATKLAGALEPPPAERWSS